MHRIYSTLTKLRDYWITCDNPEATCIFLSRAFNKLLINRFILDARRRIQDFEYKKLETQVFQRFSDHKKMVTNISKKNYSYTSYHN